MIELSLAICAVGTSEWQRDTFRSFQSVQYSVHCVYTYTPLHFRVCHAGISPFTDGEVSRESFIWGGNPRCFYLTALLRCWQLENRHSVHITTSTCFHQHYSEPGLFRGTQAVLYTSPPQSAFNQGIASHHIRIISVFFLFPDVCLYSFTNGSLAGLQQSIGMTN